MMRNQQGIEKSAPSVSTAVSSVLMPVFLNTAGLVSVKAITSTNTFAIYVGKAPRSLTSVSIRARVTTAVAGTTWAEVGVAKGAVVVGGNPTLTAVGYADVSGTWNSTGQKTTTVSVSGGQTIAEGDDLWVLIGNNATTALQVRGMSIADDIQVGVQASAVTRPSTNIGTGVSYTIESASTLGAWLALVI